MDSPWRAELYSPSSASEVAQHKVLEPEQYREALKLNQSQLLEAEINDLTQFTRDIAGQPYDPEPWLNRGHCLRVLGYPELALGDLYKARLLVEEATAITTTLGNYSFQLFKKKVYDLHTTHPAYVKWKDLVGTPELLKRRTQGTLKQIEIQIWNELMEALMAANCCADYVALSKEAIERFPDDQVFPSELANAKEWYQQRVGILTGQVERGEMTETQMETTLLSGGVYPTPYPWITEDILTRDDALINDIKAEFKALSDNCTVAKSTIRDVKISDGTGEDKFTDIDVLGVIATRDIKSGESLVTDMSFAGVISAGDRCETCCAELPLTENITNQCCNVLYCSTICSESALKSFHPVICGHDSSSLHEAAKSAESTTDFCLDALLLHRVLALSLHEDAGHPLKTSIVKRLTPAYNTRQPQLIIFNFIDHIVVPTQTARSLKIDIFANPAYDTWVLHTIRCRLQNNKHGQTLDDCHGAAISPLYSMFNHSCSPNADWRHDDHSSTVTLFALRDAKMGEELFISYIGTKRGNESREERQKTLMPWLGMRCACSRCVADGKAECGCAACLGLDIETTTNLPIHTKQAE